MANFKKLLENNFNIILMSLSLEKRKLSIVERLSETEDIAVILQIENLLNHNVNFWDSLTDEEKKNIKKGIEDLDAGKRIPYKQFRDKFRKL